jgi:hypothetical protein
MGKCDLFYSKSYNLFVLEKYLIFVRNNWIRIHIHFLCWIRIGIT